MKDQAELLVDAKCALGEGPVWDEQKNQIWWIDFDQAQLHKYDLTNQKSEIRELPEKVGSFALREKGGFIMAGEKGWSFFDEAINLWEPIVDPEENQLNTRFNDGKCDQAGRFYSGTATTNNEMEGAFYVLHPNLTWQLLLSHIGCSNGMTWSQDLKTMYYIDSLAYRVDTLDYDAQTGLTTNRQPLITFEGTDILPDGMTSDEEGMIWVAEWGGSKVSRWNPITGEKLHEIKVPTQYVTSCAFGGTNMDELFITTAKGNLSLEEQEQQPFAGGLFHVKVNVKGRKSYRFKG